MFFRKINIPKDRKGYIAVISAVIITAIVMVIALVFSSSNFLGRFDSQTLEMKDMARSAAQGCLEYARLQLAINPNYAGSETRSVGGYFCSLLSISLQNNLYLIEASSTVGKGSVKLKLLADKNTLKTVSLQEVNGF